MYSGKGVSDLRNFLSELYNAITDDSAQQSGTEYEYESEGTYRGPYMAHIDVDDGDDDQDEDEDMDVVPVVHHNGAHGYQVIRAPQQHIPIDVQPTVAYVSREFLMTRERASMPISRGSPGHMSPTAPTPTAGPSRRSRGFGHQPIVEASTSPAPSEAASNRSGGTNHSTGTAFFRNYVDAASAARTGGVITPDLVFAEIGHGRGTGPIPGTNGQLSPRREQPLVVPSGPQAYGSQIAIITNGMSPAHMPIIEDDGGSRINSQTPNGHPTNGYPVLADSSNSYQHQHTPQRTDSSSSWTQIQHEETSQSMPNSPTTRELHDSVQSAFAHRQNSDGRDVDGRGRSVKRSLRSTINAAEHYASSFLFGRGSSANVNEGPSMPVHRRDVDQHGHQA